MNQRAHDAETVFQEELGGAPDTDIALAFMREKVLCSHWTRSGGRSC